MNHLNDRTSELFTSNNGKSKAKSKSKVKPRRKAGKLTLSEKIRASLFFGLSCAGLAVSLPHLSSEVSVLTGAGAAASWFLAIVIDAGMIATKAHLSSDGHNRHVAWSIVSACTGLSIVLNSHAFLAHATAGFGQIAAVGFGLFLPLFILALSYMGAELLNRKR